MSKKLPRLRAIVGGRSGTGRTLVLEVRAFDDAMTAMRESVKALGKREGKARAVSVAGARDLLTDQPVHLLRVIRKERPESIATLARLVARPADAVTADVELLARTGLVTLESPTPRSHVRAPRVAYDRVEIRWTCESAAGLRGGSLPGTRHRGR